MRFCFISIFMIMTLTNVGCAIDATIEATSDEEQEHEPFPPRTLQPGTGGRAVAVGAQTPVIQNNSFEQPRLNLGQLADPFPGGSGWTASGAVALVRNGALQESAPLGHQWVVMRPKGSISQEVTLQPGTYTLTLLAAQTTGNSSNLSLQAKLGQFNLGMQTPSASVGKVTFNAVTITTAGTYTLSIENTDAYNYQPSLLIDHVQLNRQGTNTPPAVELTFPVNGTSAVAGATYLRATASDSDGTITKVDFYNGATFLGTSNAAPWVRPALWTSAGTYSLTAVAFDNTGATTTSAPAVFTAGAAGTPPYVLNGAFEAQFLGEPGSATNAQYGWSASTSTVGSTSNQTQSYAVVATGEGYQSAFLQPMSYDPNRTATMNQGVNLPAGTYGVSYRAAQNSSVMTLRVRFNNVDVANHVPGTAFRPFGSSAFTVGASGNYLLQFLGTSSLPYDGYRAYVDDIRIGPAGAPTVSMLSPANGATFATPGAITLVADAHDFDGTITQVEFFDGATSLGVTAYPYSLELINLAPGNHSITARATDSNGLSTTSAAVNITVAAPAAAAFFNAGFERVSQVGGYANFTAPSGWASSTGNTAMISGNNNVYIGTNPVAPEGQQVLLLSGTGWVSQDVYFPAGTYKIRVKAAQKQYSYSTNLEFRVLVGGVQYGQFAPLGYAYLSHETATFAIPTSGMYTMRIEGASPSASSASRLSIDQLEIESGPPNIAPVAAWVQPAAGTSLALPGSVLLEATATDADGTISSVHFFSGGTLLGQGQWDASSSSFKYIWTPTAAGFHNLYVRVADNLLIQNSSPPLRTFSVTGGLGSPAAAVVPWQNVMDGGDLIPWGVQAIIGGPSALLSSGEVTIYVVDSGVNGVNSPTSEIRVIDSKKIDRPGATELTCYGHGTHVAGTIGARRNGSDVAGIVPGAAIVSITRETFDADCRTTGGAGTLSDALRMVKADILSKPLAERRVGIVNVSSNSYNNTELREVMKDLATPTSEYPGVFIAQSAGNNFEDACDYAYYDEENFQNYLIRGPLYSDGIMVVGAHDVNGQRAEPMWKDKVNNQDRFVFTGGVVVTDGNAYVDAFRNFNAINLGLLNDSRLDRGSNHGNCVEVWAPGKSIKSNWFSSTHPALPSTREASGTSFAAPHIAALAAHLTNSLNLQTPAQIEQAVRSRMATMSGPDIAIANVNAAPFIAKPTVEIAMVHGTNQLAIADDLGQFETGTSPPYVDIFNPNPTTGIQTITRSSSLPFYLWFASLGANGCSTEMRYEGTVVEIISGLRVYRPQINLAPGNYLWTMTCTSSQGTQNEASFAAVITN
jgi:hypothetical protein